MTKPYTRSDLDRMWADMDAADQRQLFHSARATAELLRQWLLGHLDLWYDPTDPYSIQKAKNHQAFMSQDGRSLYAVQGHLRLEHIHIPGSVATQMWPMPDHIYFLAARKGVDMPESETGGFALLTFLIATDLAEGPNRATESAGQPGLIEALGVATDTGEVALSYAYLIPARDLSWVPKVGKPNL